MRVAFLVNEFPTFSETFILNQITGLIDRRCDVEVYARVVRTLENAHAGVLAYDLGRRTHLLGSPRSAPATSLGRVLARAGDIARGLHTLRAKTALAALDPITMGADAASLKMLHCAVTFARARPYDVLHCQFGPNGVLGAQLRGIGATRAAIVTHFRGYDASSYARRAGPHVYDALFRHGTLFLCVCNRIRERVMGLGAPADRTRVHRSGIALSNVRYSPRTRTNSDPANVLSVARLVEKKGVEHGIRAIAMLAGRRPNLRYTIAGEGPLRARLTELANELGLGDRVHFVGSANDVQIASLMKNADVLLAPSITADDGDEEGIPVVLMEALAGGLPVVTTVHGGIPELVVDGDTGLLAVERDVSGLARQLERVLSDPRAANEMTQRGREAVAERHDIERLNKSLLDVYAEAVDLSKQSTR